MYVVMIDGILLVGPVTLEVAIETARRYAIDQGKAYQIHKLVQTHHVKPPITLPPDVEEVK